jgi:cation:H+ antiporter
MAGAVVVDLGLVVVAAVALWIGATLLVDGAVALAGRVGLSETVVGLTVVAVGTSAPELVVTVDAAVEGQPDIAVANVVGSNVFNLGFVLGGLALAGGVPASRDLVRRDGPVLVAAALLVTAFLLDGRLVAWEGAVLVVFWLSYVAALLLRGRGRGTRRDAARSTGTGANGDSTSETGGGGTSEAAGEPADVSATIARLRSLPRTVGAVLVGLVALLAGARLLVGSASDLARVAGIAEWVVGITVVATGTSMPELATAVAAARRGSHGVSAGALIGSDLSNLLLALGLAAVAEPLIVGAAVVPDFALLVVAIVLAVSLSLTDERLSRPEGGVLVALAAARWVVPLV